MYNSPLALPQQQIQSSDQPFDLASWLKKTLLGGQNAEQLDPNMSVLLRSLLGEPKNGQTI